MTVLLVVLAVGFAYSMGAHYTGACMGMPHALGAISARWALVVMAPLTLVGATFASHRVEHTVAHDLLARPGLSVTGLVVVVGVAFALTSLFNKLRLPTSTIQILVFAVVGAGLAAGIRVRWSTIVVLGVIWVCAPVVAAVVGFGLTRLLDVVPGIRGGERCINDVAAEPATGAGAGARGASRAISAVATTSAVKTSEGAAGQRVGSSLAGALIVVGALASFTMGSNDVANATGSLVSTKTFTPLTAGFVGGIALAAGVLTWGRPLLRKVAFDIVSVDRPMATAAQFVQAGVVFAAVVFGFFTSMNQALVGAMAGAAAARGRQTVHRSSLYGVVRGWLIGPAAGIAIAYAVTWLVATTAGLHSLTATR